jgi:sulfur-oxidizing protein SoxY
MSHPKAQCRQVKRRQILGASLLALACYPARATPAALQAAINNFAGGVPVQDVQLNNEKGQGGRLQLSMSPLVENGNTVPVELWVPGGNGSTVRRLALLTELNPQPEVAVFALGPLAGSARVATRMRLATSQTVVALAQLADGSVWQHRVSVVVTLAACIEGG